MSGEPEVHSQVACANKWFQINLEGALPWARAFQRKEPQAKFRIEEQTFE